MPKGATASFLAVQQGALALAPAIHDGVGECVAKGLRNVFFLGAGGAAILMQPAALLMQRRSALPVFTPLAAELVIEGHPALGAGSLVVIPSVSGTTKESVAALEFCRARGASVFSLVGHANTPLAERADRAFINFAADDTASESLYLQSLLVALSIMAHRGEYAAYAATVAELAALPRHLLSAKQHFEPEARGLRPHSRARTITSSRVPAVAGPRPGITPCACWKSSSGCAQGPCTRRIFSTAHSSLWARA